MLLTLGCGLRWSSIGDTVLCPVIYTGCFLLEDRLKQDLVRKAKNMSNNSLSVIQVYDMVAPSPAISPPPWSNQTVQLLQEDTLLDPLERIWYVPLPV